MHVYIYIYIYVYVYTDILYMCTYTVSSVHIVAPSSVHQTRERNNCQIEGLESQKAIVYFASKRPWEVQISQGLGPFFRIEP